MKKHYTFLITFILFAFSGNISAVKTDVWDFGAEQLPTEQYNNQLTVEIINGWYPASVTPGSISTSNVFPPNFPSVGGLSWKGGTNDRLRTTNTSLTRYDANIGGADGYTGRLYQNGAGVEPPARFFTFQLNEDDEVTLVTRTDGTGKLNFKNVASGQRDTYDLGSDLVSVKFVAKTAGDYQMYASDGKPSYYRIYRKPAEYVTVSGKANVTNASDIPASYTVNFTNQAGKTWAATVDASHQFSVQLPVGYTYHASLGNANGYIISGNDELTVTDNTTYNPVILKVNLKTLTGTIQGLPTSLLNKLGLEFTTTTPTAFLPTTQINAETGAYSVQLEADVNYTISATGVNDYFISNNSVSINQPTSTNIQFVQKPLYVVNLNVLDVLPEMVSEIKPSFTNLNESGYVYDFQDVNSVMLRDGVYSIQFHGLDNYPLQLGLTSNLNVAGANVTKDIRLVPVTVWSFDDKPIVSGSTTAYKGLLFTGAPYNEQAKGHLVLKNNDAVKVPIVPGQKMTVTYYYSAKFTVDGGAEVSTNSGSTSQFETKEFIYTGDAAGYMQIANVPGATTYITEISVAKIVPYAKEIFVGIDKDFATINDALSAVRSMDRNANDTVKIYIEPGNYEEMLVVDVPNIWLINAAESPDIALANKGVDISTNAVRITSYYGHGYNYFSMGNNQKWNADALRVNRENGYTTYSNTGAGTTNGSYWNATVVVSAPGFRADNIIFENSFNQYISQKEAADVVQEWSSGGKGVRPTDYGNTAVQNKSFVERAAAIAFTQSCDRAILNKCRVIGRQDSFYGAEGARVVAYKGSLMGATDYIFGGMTLVAYQTELAMNTSEASTDVAYITAAQQSSSRGYLMYENTVTTAIPGTETASAYRSKPGYFGRPWQANTSEVVFYNTTIETSDNPAFSGQSLIVPVGWNNTLGGTSDRVYEYGTVEKSGVDNSANRASWSKILTTPTLTDGTEITPFNFTKGNDGWDPISMLKSLDNTTDVKANSPKSTLQIGVSKENVFISNVDNETQIRVYGMDGRLHFFRNIYNDVMVTMNPGFWIVKANSPTGEKAAKVIIR